MEKGRIRITLKSDLCAGSGYSYAGIIDSDVCYDQAGIPYIPARRIKGLLRESAEMIGVDTTVFGKWGQDNVKERTGLSISNAYIENYFEIRKALDEAKENDAIENLLSPDAVLSQFSSVKAATALDQAGSAKENSLRFMRIVNHYSPFDKNKEQIFYADVQIPDRSGVSQISAACLALRHMGVGRNRGLGNVVFALEEEQKKEQRLSRPELVDESRGSGKAVLTYTVRSESCLMLSKKNSQESERFMDGMSVLGYFASAYLRSGNKAEDEAFENLFLKGGVSFSPLFPSDETGRIFYPAPSFINRLKKTGDYVNVSIPRKEQLIEPGNQPKKLTGKFLAFPEDGEGAMELKEVQTEILYHNRHEKQDLEKMLYAFEAVSPNQYFTGHITGDVCDLRKLYQAIGEDGMLTFGKSRGAQYGLCRVVSASLSDLPHIGKEDSGERYTLLLSEGEKILVTFRSDGLFMDGEGNYSVSLREALSQVKSKLGICSAEEGYLEADVREIVGHYGVWNLKRQTIPSIQAGSTFEFCLKEACVLPRSAHVGVRNAEGFGEVSIIRQPGIWKISQSEKEKVKGTGAALSECDLPESIRPIYHRVLMEAGRQKALKKALQVRGGGMSKSLLGRVTLMLEESRNQNPESSCNAKAAFDKRIESIKDKGKKTSVTNFVNDYYNGFTPDGINDNEDIAFLRIYCLEQALVTLKYKKKGSDD